MKLTPNKNYTLILLLTGLFGFAKQGPPPPPAGPPPPPGFPIDTNVYVLIFFGILFTFIFFRNFIKSTKNT